MNILWLSVPPYCPTGYGTQTQQVTRRLKQAGHNVAISVQSGLQWAQWDYQGIHLYPSDHTRLNKYMLRHHVADWAERCDCAPHEVQVISLFDVWPWVDPAPQFGGMVADFHGLNIAAWVPVDSVPVTPMTVQALNEYQARPIAMSRFGEEQLRLAGLDPLYAPHAIDTNVYTPRDRADGRKLLNIPDDKFVVGVVAHNEGTGPTRKNWANTLMAFSIFHRKHADSTLYLHSEVTGRPWGGANLMGMAHHFGIPLEAVQIVPQVPYLSNGISPEGMSYVYSALDVLSNASYGEGFGLPIVEAQACGTPVIVTEYTSMPELCGAGWRIGGEPWFNESSAATWMHPSVDEHLAALEAAYGARGDIRVREAAREFAVAYDADGVFDEFWVPVMDALGRPREVPPLPNRAMRRAAKKVAA